MVRESAHESNKKKTGAGMRAVFSTRNATVVCKPSVCGPYDMEGFQKCLHPLKVLAKAYV